MRHKHNGGFTIVELLIVVVVIGILATVAIVSYNGIRNRTLESSLQSDLRSSQKAILMSAVTSGAYPADASSLQVSNGATYEYTVDNSSTPRTFCLTATINTKSYFIDQDGNPAEGACVGHSNGGVQPSISWADQLNSDVTGAWVSPAISNDGQRMLVSKGGNAYAYISLNGGASWSSPTSSGLGQYFVAATSDGSTFYIAKYQAIKQSTDGGTSWSTLSSAPLVTWNDIEVSDTGAVLAARSGTSLYTSEDSGSTWTSAATIPSGSLTDIALSGNGEVLYASNGSTGIYKSTDHGATWATLPNMSGSRIDTSYNGDVLYSGAGASVRYSTDGGQTSVILTVTGASIGDLKTASSNPRAVITRDLTTGYIYTSLNSGQTWTQETGLGSYQWRGIAVSNNGQYFIALRYSHYVIKGEL